jgi:WS/DGAT/MGAT family acyltransferase
VHAVQLGAGLVRHAPGLAAATFDRLAGPNRSAGAAPDAAGDDPVLPHPGLRAPKTPFNARITPHRRVAVADLPLAQVDELRARVGASVNDIVMALTAGALRRWLLEHEALPETPLVAAVPVSVRDQSQQESYGNRVSALLAVLPTHLDDPGHRLAGARAAMLAAKRDLGAIPPTLLADVTELAPPVLAGLGWKLAARLDLMQRVNPWNLFVSNVPGPTSPLYYAGAKVVAYFPLSALAHGQGLNITAFSYHDRLCFGLLADRTLVPDVDTLAAHLGTELDDLLTATGGPAGGGVRPGRGGQSTRTTRPRRAVRRRGDDGAQTTDSG